MLYELKIHPNKGFLACRGLKLWETYFFYNLSHLLSWCKMCAKILCSLRGVLSKLYKLTDGKAGFVLFLYIMLEGRIPGNLRGYTFTTPMQLQNGEFARFEACAYIL